MFTVCDVLHKTKQTQTNSRECTVRAGIVRREYGARNDGCYQLSYICARFSLNAIFLYFKTYSEEETALTKLSCK